MHHRPQVSNFEWKRLVIPSIWALMALELALTGYVALIFTDPKFDFSATQAIWIAIRGWPDTLCHLLGMKQAPIFTVFLWWGTQFLILAATIKPVRERLRTFLRRSL